jgi:glycosyltransferase involved in cell wall biosynthesis
LAVYPADRICKIHSGVDIHRYENTMIDVDEKKTALGLNGGWPVVGTVGWLLPIKGSEVLFKAMLTVWQVHPHAELVYVGRGPLRQLLETEAARNKVSGKVHFLGWRKDIQEILPILDIFVLPSMNEGMGRVLVEAMASQKPIVASRTGGIPDLVEHGQNGLLVPPGDAQRLASAIIHLLDNPEDACAMGMRGKRLCCEFTVEKMIDRLDTLYSQLI